jgi:uncharacterized protein YkwD
MRVLKQNLLAIVFASFVLWLVFFFLNSIPNSSVFGPDISKDCAWKSVSLDANLDGIFSYSDVPIWLSAIFVSFQKFLIANLYDTSIGHFIELNKSACRSVKAQAVTFLTLLVIFFFFSKITLTAVNALAKKPSPIQRDDLFPATVPHHLRSGKFIEAIWSLQFKLIFIALVFIVIGSNWYFLNTNQPSDEKRIATKKDLGKIKINQPSPESNQKEDSTREDAKNNLAQTTEILKYEIKTNAQSVPIADKYEDLILKFVNKERSIGATCGDKYFQPAPSLRKNQKLDEVALTHAKDMAVADYFSHTSKNGDQLRDRVSKQDYSWSTIGENIAKGQKTSSQVVNDWMKSPGHCSNIMNPAFTELGVGRDDNFRKEYIWVQVFGKDK